MSSVKHMVDEQIGVSIHREIPAKRPAEDFDLRQISPVTKNAFKRVCADGDATPEDYRHVFESLLGRNIVNDLLT